MTLADLDRVIDAVDRVLSKPEPWCRGSEALGTACGKCARCQAHEALTLLRKMREGAVEVQAWRYDGAWLASSHSPGTSGDIVERPALLITPEDG